MTYNELIERTRARDPLTSYARCGKHRGYLVAEHGDGARLRIRDSSRRGGRQYMTLFERDVETGRLEVKVGARYRPARDV